MENVTINVNDQNGPLTGVLISVYGDGGGVVVSGPSPLVTTILPGDWSVELAATDDVVTASPYSITVADTDGMTPQTFAVGPVTTLTITDPARPVTVRLFGYLVGGNGRPVSTRVVVRTFAWGQRQPYVTPPGSPAPAIDPQVIAVLPELREARSDPATGRWDVDVVAGVKVRVEIPELRYAKTFSMPSDGTVALDIRDARPDPGPQGVEEYLAALPEQVGP